MSKTFKRDGVEECLFFSEGGRDHLLVKVRGRGWFRDTRGGGNKNATETPPPKKEAVLSCILTKTESGFEKAKVTTYKIARK